MTRVLLADDGAPGARHAEEWAVWLAKHLGAEVHLAVAGTHDGQQREKLIEATFHDSLPDAKQVAQEIASRLAQHGVQPVMHVAPGPPAQLILGLDRDIRPTILLMGSHETGRLQFRGSGTVIDHVKNNVEASILVARAGRPRTVAAAVDGSLQSIQAALLAAAWAAQLRVPFTVLLAADQRLPGPLQGQTTVAMPDPAAASIAGWTLQHRDALLVLGSRGAGGTHVLQMGSVSDRVTLTAHCSVLVVRPSRELHHATSSATHAPRAAPVVLVERVHKRFGKFEALRGLDLEIQAGELYGLIGPNGAGKTTAIRILAGLLRPTSGRIQVLGHNAGDHAVRSQVGYMPQETALYSDLTVQENLDHFGRLFGMGRRQRSRRIEELLGFVGLQERARSLVGELSGGMRHRTSLAAALMPRPRLLVLDEPTVGVDPELRQAFWERFAAMRREGTTILLTTHYMDEARHCGRVGFLHEGRMATEGTPQEILRKTGTENLEDAFLATMRARAGAGQ